MSKDSCARPEREQGAWGDYEKSPRRRKRMLPLPINWGVSGQERKVAESPWGRGLAAAVPKGKVVNSLWRHPAPRAARGAVAARTLNPDHRRSGGKGPTPVADGRASFKQV